MRITLTDDSHLFKNGAVTVLERLGYQYSVETDCDDNLYLEVTTYDNNSSERSKTNFWDCVKYLISSVYWLLVWIVLGGVAVAALNH